MRNIFKGYFNKKSSSRDVEAQDAEVSEVIHSPDQPVEQITSITKPVTEPVLHLESPQIIAGFAQSIGIQRETNEDSLFTLTSNLNTNGVIKNFGLYMIADGMGGHEAGEVASRIAIEKMSAYIIDTLFLPSISINNNQLDNSIQEVLRKGAINAHQAIKHNANGSGTTLTAALVVGDQLTIAHVGDSRAYLIEPDWRMQLLTHDHSLVKRLEEIGQLTPAEASRHPKRNMLYRALGLGDQVEPELYSLHIFPAQMLLICTDGLWGEVPEIEVVDIVHSSTEPQIACQALIDAANSAGGPDNISVILVRFPG